MNRAIRHFIRFKAPKFAPQRSTVVLSPAARIWEAARIAEKYDNYCMSTPGGLEARYNGRLYRIIGETAATAIMATPAGVDTSDWILYLFALND